MAECFPSPMHFLIFVFILQTSDRQVAAIGQSINIARGSIAWQSSGSSNASNAIDSNTSTCTSTLESEGKGSWMIDLREERVVNSVHLDSGSTPLTNVDIFVGDEPDPGYPQLYMCDQSSKDASTSFLKKCSRVQQGRYVHVRTQLSETLTLCEVKVFECEDGTFGGSCRYPCHCEGGVMCDKLSGYCPNANCASGWGGQTCQDECLYRQWGINCNSRCHCEGEADCNKVDGSCPDNTCEPGWLGPACQTALPELTEPPDKLSVTRDSITLRWSLWKEFVDPELQLVFKVRYRDSDSSLDKLIDFSEEITQDRQLTYNKVTVTGLETSTHYYFQIVPFIIAGDVEIEGSASPESLSVKTDCSPPEPPNIESVNAGLDESSEPAEALLTVKWHTLTDDQINCDGIKFYRIEYQEQNTASWDSVLATSLAHTKNITSLKFGTTYKVKVVVVNNRDYNGISRIVVARTVASDAVPLHQVSTFTSEESPPFGIIIGILVAILIVFIAIAFFIYRRRNKYCSVPVKDENGLDDLAALNSLLRNKNSKHVEVPNEHTPLDLDDSGVMEGSASEATPSSGIDTLESVAAMANAAVEETPQVLQMPEDRHIINVEELEGYIAERRGNDNEGLRKEYEEIPMGFTAKHDVGKSNEHKHKNRFVNIIAYDHSRVIMEKWEGDPDSDYINANYIDGYNKPRAYIAAQGCNKYTIQDMWRMVWEEKSLRIVMVTNLIENGKRKCEIYWPEDTKEDKVFGDIRVRLLEVEETTDFTIRNFQVSNDEETRNVKQFHFTAWPDHGVPTRASPIISFRRKVRSYDESHPGIIVVHCSAGVGRTGTFIALDYLLEKAAIEGVVDIYGLTWQMRRDRVNMIQTVEQYIFVYDALLEALKAGDTTIPCAEYEERFKQICAIDPEKGRSKLEQEFQLLQLMFPQNLYTMSPKVKLTDCSSGASPENVGKNRVADILPADRHRPYLMLRVEGTNDYINAVFLDGFKKRNAYIMTQMPLPHTVIDFWRMIYEHNCHSVVMLNTMDEEDETYGQYWMEEEGCECGPFVIEPHRSDTSNPHITVREIKLLYEPQQSPSQLSPPKEEKPRIIGQFQFNMWPQGMNVPPEEAKAQLVTLIDLVERWQMKTGDGPIIVHCHDGVSQSGLYTALSCIWEKMKVDQEVDIFHAVKHLRYHRPTVINSLEQYKFCYEMVLEYFTQFATYSNFR